MTQSHGITKEEKVANNFFQKKLLIVTQSYFSIAEIETALKIYVSELDVSAKEKEEKEVFEEILKQDNPVVEYFRKLEMNVLVSNDKKEKNNVFDYFEEKRKAAEPFLNKQYEQSELISNKEAKTAIKDYLDACLNILHFAKPLYVLPPRKDDAAMPEKDNAFYNEFDELYKQIEGTILPVYNKVRSYLTQKPYSVEKFKLNFENVSLLKGWDVNKEVQNTCVLLRKDGLFYVGIMDKEHNNIFTDENIPSSNSEKEFYEKMYYKLLPGPNKMLPKVFFSEKNIQFFNPSKSLLEKYEQGTHKKVITSQRKIVML